MPSKGWRSAQYLKNETITCEVCFLQLKHKNRALHNRSILHKHAESILRDRFEERLNRIEEPPKKATVKMENLSHMLSDSDKPKYMLVRLADTLGG